MKINKDVPYSAGGISLIVDDITDLYEESIIGVNEVVINTSSQPNSRPHLGTMTTLMTAFLLAKKISDRFNIPAIVEFDMLENSPYEEVEKCGETYTKSLGDSLLENEKISDIYMKKYYFLFDKLLKLTGIHYRVRSYHEFQANSIIRSAVINIYNKYDKMKKMLDPSRKQLFLRTKCPICAFSNRNSQNFKFYVQENEIHLWSKCFKHGEYEVVFNESNTDYIDMNTQLRDLVKGIYIAETDLSENRLTIMCDGKDWSGEWASKIHYSAMMELGYNKITNRVFTPLITDWSGGKYSKSIYLQKDIYSGEEKIFADFDLFYNKYGEEGFNKIYNEVSNWVNDPIKFFRNYSIEYLEMILNDKEEQNAKN